MYAYETLPFNNNSFLVNFFMIFRNSYFYYMYIYTPSCVCDLILAIYIYIYIYICSAYTVRCIFKNCKKLLFVVHTMKFK